MKWRTLAFVFFVWIGCSIYGCAPKRYMAPVPGCVDAYVYVPKGCYVEDHKTGDTVELRCPTSTTTYRCKDKK